MHSDRTVQLLIGLCAACLLMCGASQAGELKVSTVNLSLTAGQPRTSLTITNVGAQPTLIHIRAFRWGQSNGNDDFAPAPEMAVNPPMTILAEGASQLLRIGYLETAWPQSEGTYRLFIEEVPMVARARLDAVETYLRLSIPIFLSTGGPHVEDLRVSLSRERNTLLFENFGNRHVRVQSYDVLSNGKSLGQTHRKLQYILAKTKVTLPLASPLAAGSTPDQIKLVTDDGDVLLSLAPSRGRS